ncbi:hypothetical protein V2J09_009817 [Rumex salicifolius]
MGISDNSSGPYNSKGYSYSVNSTGSSSLLLDTRSLEERITYGDILEQQPTLKIFSFLELQVATKDFDVDNVLGVGGFGKVYRGWIDLPSKPESKTVVAIKKLNSQSIQGFEQWQTEVNFLACLFHPHLVTLLGYCWEHKELLLVYEYMSKGSLEKYLFKRSMEPLSWDARISIALGAAHGLAFLHTLERQNYNAKLSDFGLAKFGPPGEDTHIATRIMGTYGYVAPEYVATGCLYVKSDVYGFGVVLLELLTGVPAIDPKRPNGQQNLVEWTRPILSKKNKVDSIMDARLYGQYTVKAAQETAKLTAKCLQREPKARPSMQEVVLVLQKIESMNGMVSDRRSNYSWSSDYASL